MTPYPTTIRHQALLEVTQTMRLIDQAMTRMRLVAGHVADAGLPADLVAPYPDDKTLHDKVTHHLAAAMIEALDIKTRLEAL